MLVFKFSVHDNWAIFENFDIIIFFTFFLIRVKIFMTKKLNLQPQHLYLNLNSFMRKSIFQDFCPSNSVWSSLNYFKSILRSNGSRKPYTVTPRFTVPRFNGYLDLLGLNLLPRKQALRVNQCKLYPDLPCSLIYWA